MVVNEATQRRPPTVPAALAEGEEYLRKSGVVLARMNAEYLLAQSLRLPRWRLYTEPRRFLFPEAEQEYRYLLSRRAEGLPLAYILGEVGFHDLDLKIDCRAFIPRPETELLVEAALPRLGPGCRVLDVGCGSGAIALALARAAAGIEVFASDLSPDAVSLARENAERLAHLVRIEFREGDLFEPWGAAFHAFFDLVVSNPPYVSCQELDRLPREVALHEPRLALDGGEDGLRVIARLIGEAPSYLRPGGWLLFEIGFDQAERVRVLLERRGAFSPPEVIKDYSGHDRVVAAQISDKWEVRSGK